MIRRLLLAMAKGLGLLLLLVGSILLISAGIDYLTHEVTDVSMFGNAMLGVSLFTAPFSVYFIEKTLRVLKVRKSDTEPDTAWRFLSLFVLSGGSVLLTILSASVYLVYLRSL